MKKDIIFFITYITLLTFFINITSPPSVIHSKTEYPSPIAIIGVEDKTGKLSSPSEILDILQTELAKYENISIIEQKQILELLNDLPPTVDNAVEIASALGAKCAIIGVLSDFKHIPRPVEVQITLDLKMYEAETSLLMSRAVVIGTSGIKPGYGGDLESLLSSAIQSAASDAFAEIFSNLEKQGTISSIRDGEIYTTLTERQGVKAGAQVSVVGSGGKQIAILRITSVKLTHSVAKVIQQLAGERPKVGDRCRLIFNPSPTLKRADVPLTEEAKSRGRKKISPLLLAVLGVGLVSLVTSRDKPKTQKALEQEVAAKPITFPGNLLYIIPPPSGFPVATKIDVINCSLQKNLQGETESCLAPPPYPEDTEEGVGLTSLKETLFYISSNKTFPEPNVPTLKIYIPNCNSLSQYYIYYFDESKQKWVVIGDKASCSYASVSITHFSYFIIVKDERPPRPVNFTVTGKPKAIQLTWEPPRDLQGNIVVDGYLIYFCDKTGICTQVKIINDKTQGQELMENLYANSEYCYAIASYQNTYSNKGALSEIKCATTTDIPENARVELISPENGQNITTQKPEFKFLGAVGAVEHNISVYYNRCADEDCTQKTKVFVWPEAKTGCSGIKSATSPFCIVPYAGDPLINKNTYFWFVNAVFSDGTRIKSSEFYFVKVDSTICVFPSSLPPELLSPPNGANITTDKPTFSWSKFDCATKYIITVKDETGVIVFQKEVTDTTVEYDGTAIVENIQYSWYVQASDGYTNSKESNPFFFIRVPTEVPPLAPPQWVDTNPLLGGDQVVAVNWKPNSESTLAGYIIERATKAEGPFTEVARLSVDQLSFQSVEPPCITYSKDNPGYCDIGVTNGTRYYYRLRAYNVGKQKSDPSAVKNILLPLQRPELIAPGSVAGNYELPRSLYFHWMPVSGAQMYEYYLYDITMDMMVFKETLQDTKSSNISKDFLIPEHTYKWWVIAYNDLVKSEPSQYFKFTVKSTKITADPPVWNTFPPDPDEPLVADASARSIKLNWHRNTEENVIKYKIYRATQSSGPYTPIAEQVQPSSTQNYVQFIDTNLTLGQYYFYRLTALDSSGAESYQSETKYIFLPLIGPTLILPADGQRVESPNPVFSWHSINGNNVQYILQVGKKGMPNLSDQNNINWSIVTTETSVTFADPDYPPPLKPLENPFDPEQASEYYWQVCAINDISKTPTSCSEVRKFYKKFGVPEPVSPLSGQHIVEIRPIFKWTRVYGAAGYTIRLCKGNVTNCSASDKILWVYDVEGEESISVQLPSNIDLDNCKPDIDPDCQLTGVYSWQVRAYDLNGMVSGEWGNIQGRSFIKVSTPPPQLLTPQDGQIVGPYPSPDNCAWVKDMYGNLSYNYAINFTWSSVPNADSYHIKVIDIEASLDNPNCKLEDGDLICNPQGQEYVVWQDTVQSNVYYANAQCPGGDASEIPLSAGRKYAWNVAAVDPNGNVLFDDSNQFQFITGLPSPNLRGPNDQEMVILAASPPPAHISIQFSWDKVFGAASYDIDIRKSDGTKLDCITGDPYHNTPYTFFDCYSTTPTHGETYTWRVRARDGLKDPNDSGNPSPWTQTRIFTVYVPGPKLSAPYPTGLSCEYSEPGHKPMNCYSPCRDAIIAQDWATIRSQCSIVEYRDQSFFWSPIPYANAQYRIQISDDMYFNNIVWEQSTTQNPGDFPTDLCVGGGYCEYRPSVSSTFLPMVNGVTYYWRVGACVGEFCGDVQALWSFSDVWEFYKIPPRPQTFNCSSCDITSCTLEWTVPSNYMVPGDASSQPGVPPQPGSWYVVRMGDFDPEAMGIYFSYGDTGGTIAGLDPDTNYQFCITVIDAYGPTRPQPGHQSEPWCDTCRTLPEEEE